MVFPQPILQCVVEKPRYTAACEVYTKSYPLYKIRLSPDTLWKVLWIKWIASFCDRFTVVSCWEEWQPIWLRIAAVVLQQQEVDTCGFYPS